jgi:hypothetical protein
MKKLEKMIKKLEKIFPGGRVFILDTEDEENNWSGDCLFIFPYPIEFSPVYAYVGDSLFVRTNDGKEMEFDLDEDIGFWKLPLDYYDTIDFVEFLSSCTISGFDAEAKEEVKKIKEEIINKKIKERENEIRGLQCEISRLKSFLS